LVLSTRIAPMPTRDDRFPVYFVAAAWLPEKQLAF
jgi:hypothetical protein